MEAHSPELLKEDDRLEDADKQTKEWWAVQKVQKVARKGSI